MPVAAYGQGSSAAINGNIKDSSGAVIQGATISLTNALTGVSRDTVSNSTGDYVFIDVLPAAYTIKVANEGFATITQQEVTLNVNQTATFDFTMSVGSTQQAVTVEATAVGIQASTAELGTVINQQSVQELPLNGRNFTQLLTLTPGASPISVAQNSGGGGGFAGNAIGSFSFPALNGQRNRSNMFLLDDVIDLGSFIGNYNVQPIVDTVQEFKVQSHNDLAEFGQAPGGIVNVVTRSGTNSYHGSVWEFLRNDVLDAGNPFVLQEGTPRRNALHQNQFGAAGGGPVWIPKLYNGKNRTFFFAGYEGYRQSVASQSQGLAATTAQLSGDFSAPGNNIIYDPTTGLPFPGNKIPASRINAISAAYAAGNMPTGPAVIAGNNYIFNAPIETNQDTYSIRADQTFGEKDTLFGRVSHFDEPQTSPNGYQGAIRFANNYGYNAVLHETHTFGPTAVLDGFFGRNEGTADTGSSVPGAGPNFANDLAALGLSTNFIGGFRGQSGLFVPQMGVSGYVGGAGTTAQNTVLADNWTFGGSFTKIKGAHTIKGGVTFTTNNTMSPIDYNSESFSNTQTASPSGGGGNTLASFLLGLPDGANKRNVLEKEHGGWVDGFYLQDQFKITPKLTLNVGIRWDLTLWPIYGKLPEPDAFVGDVNLSDGTYVLANVPAACSSTQGYPCIPGGILPEHVTVTTHANNSIYSNDYGNWQPRIGMAYRITDKTAVRAGYGRFFDNYNSIIQLAQNYEGTWPDLGQLIAQNLNTPAGAKASIADPFNQGTNPVVFPAPSPFLSGGFVNWYVSPVDYKMPYADQWNVGVEQALGSNTVLDLSYVGSHDGRLNQGGQGNTSVRPSPATATSAEIQALRPYPYIPPTFYDQSVGQSKYNSFQFRLQQRATKGLTYIISYTRSKSMDRGCSGSFGAEGCGIQFPYNTNLDRSVSGYDLPNIFSASWVYDIPVGKGKAFSTHNAALDYIVGNWQIGGILSLHSGTPFTVEASNSDAQNTGNTEERANLLLPDAAYAHATNPSIWLNPAAFGEPAIGTYGNLGRNSLRTDSYRNLDISLTRNFPIKEWFTLQFRGDAFNLCNFVVQGQPSNTVDSPNFGIVTSANNTPRVIQFALKLLF